METLASNPMVSTMTRKRGVGRPSKNRVLTTLKAPDDLVQMLRLIAVKRRLSLPDAFDSLCRETIDKAHLEVARDISRAIPRADKS